MTAGAGAGHRTGTYTLILAGYHKRGKRNTAQLHHIGTPDGDPHINPLDTHIHTPNHPRHRHNRTPAQERRHASVDLPTSSHGHGRSSHSTSHNPQTQINTPGKLLRGSSKNTAKTAMNKISGRSNTIMRTWNTTKTSRNRYL